MNKLKPCPFCGQKVKIMYKKPQAMITCPECKLFMARMDWEDEADGRRRLAEAWNRRADNGDSCTL